MQRGLSSAEHGMLRTGLDVVMVAELAREVGADDLRDAIMRVRPACPLLGARLVRDARGVYQVRAEEGAPPVRVLPQAASWHGAALDELTYTFDAEHEPLARFALLPGGRGTTLLTNTHHCVSDGLSGAWLVGVLLQALRDPSWSLPPAGMPPAVDDLCPPGLLAPPLVAALGAAGAACALLGPARTRARPKEPCGLLAWVLDEAETTRLVEACRAAGVTVHAALCAAFRLAEVRVQGRRRRLARLYTPVSVRTRLTRPAGDAFGFYASEAAVRLPVRPTDDLASVLRRADAAVREGTANRRVLRLPAMTGVAHPFLTERVVAAIRARRGLRFGTAICNLGRAALPEAAAPLLRDLHGPLPYLERVEKALTVVTTAGRMSFVMVWRRRAVREDVVVEVRDRAMEMLRAAPATGLPPRPPGS